MHIRICTNNPYPVTTKEVILLNDYYFQLNPYSDGKLEMSDVGFASNADKKRTDNNNNNTNNSKYLFDSNENDCVTIGRETKCTISFPNDKSFSKVHTTISYIPNKNYWLLKDGDNDKPSTNGTWIYASHSYEINDNTIFQFGNSNFIIKIRQ
jgi:hypothetical protein